MVIVERSGEHHVPLASKEEVADAILDRVETLRGRGRSPALLSRRVAAPFTLGS